MPLTEPVCSIAFAQRLKELGAPQESKYCWVEGVVRKWDPSIKEYISAYTEEEIFELSPDYIPRPGARYDSELVETADEYHAYYRDGSKVFDDVIFSLPTAVDATAQMLIHLLENRSFKPKYLKT